jgi:hypothetical protein
MVDKNEMIISNIMDKKTELEVQISNYRIETLTRLIDLSFDQWGINAIRFSMKDGFRMKYKHTTNNYSKAFYHNRPADDVKGTDRTTIVDFKFDGSTVALSGTIIKTYCRCDDTRLIMFMEDIILDLDADKHEEWIETLQHKKNIPEWLLIKTIIAINKYGYENFASYFLLGE